MCCDYVWRFHPLDVNFERVLGYAECKLSAGYAVHQRLETKRWRPDFKHCDVHFPGMCDDHSTTCVPLPFACVASGPRRAIRIQDLTEVFIFVHAQERKGGFAK